MNSPFIHSPLKNTFTLLSFFLLCLLCYVPQVIGQGLICEEAVEFCPLGSEEAVTFPAGVNSGTAELGNDYGCLGTQPNPAWYYLQIGEEGNIIIELSNTGNEDIDFVLYGPFSSLDTTLNSCGTLINPIDCSYSGSSTETVNIPSSEIGEIYLLLITNFSNDPTDIIGDVTGEGTVSCCALAEENGASCNNASLFNCYCWNRGLEFELANTVDTMISTSCDIQESYQWLSFDACYCAATLELSTENCSAGQIINAQLFSECDTLPVTNCLDLTGNNSDLLISTEGSSIIDFTPNDNYQLLVSSDTDSCSYKVKMTEIPVAPPVFEEDMITGETVVCENDTVIYNFQSALGADFQQISFSTIGTQIFQDSANFFRVIYGENSGVLCITAFNCGGFISICADITVQSAEECENPVSVFGVAKNSQLTVFPNPTQRNIYFETEINAPTWEIINLAGQVLKTGKAQRGFNSLNIENLSAGIYFIKVTGDESKIGKFIVED